MRIAFIGQKGIPAKTEGIEKHVEEISSRMAKEGHEVFVYVRNSYTPKKLVMYKSVRIIHMPSLGVNCFDAAMYAFFASIHSVFCRFDVIHYHGIGPAILSFIPKFFKPKTLVIATLHSQNYCNQKWDAFSRFSFRLGTYATCKIPDKTIATDKILAKLSKEKYDCQAQIVPNGADMHRTKRTDVLSKLGIKSKRYVLSQGKLAKHKGFHYLIEAFKQLENTAKIPNNFKLVIVGDGSGMDDYVKFLHTITEGRDNIIFAGVQKGNALQQLFSHAYLFVQPSESKGMSHVLLEAMGYSLASLVSDAKENVEVVGENGFKFTSKSVVDLRDKLAYLLNRPDEVAKASDYAKKRIQKEYSWDSIVRKTIDIYKQALLEKSSSR